MTFDLIIPDSLWAVRYDGDEENAFYQAFEQWSDPIWLRDFFFQNKVVDAEGFIDLLQTK